MSPVGKGLVYFWRNLLITHLGWLLIVSQSDSDGVVKSVQFISLAVDVKQYVVCQPAMDLQVLQAEYRAVWW